MQPLPQCIHFLATHQFIRNYSVDPLLERGDDIFLKNDMIWYCVGTINNKRYIHCIKFLKRTPKPGISSYFIEWFKTASYSNEPIEEIPLHFESISFWVHSGVALRKNFFLFQDRMSLLRSTFYYDIHTNTFFRMASLLPYLQIPEEIPNHVIIYTSEEKRYQYQKRSKKTISNQNIKRHHEFRKQLKKFCCCHNLNRFLENEYPKLFHQIEIIISENGDTSRFFDSSK